MLVYIFIFGVVFRARIDIPGVPQNYTVYIVSGLLPWLGLVDALGRSSLAIAGNEALVKQIVIPTEVLVVRSVLAALFTQVSRTLPMCCERTHWGRAWPRVEERAVT